jgi:hypothetical protein
MLSNGLKMVLKLKCKFPQKKLSKNLQGKKTPVIFALDNES